MISLYHCQGARSLRPLWCLEEMGLAYELVIMPFPPRVFKKEYLGVNPLGTIPYMIDGDVRMTESVGACQYLAARYGPTPLAVSPEEKDFAAYLNWLHHADATLTFPLAIMLRYTRVEPPERQLAQAVEDYAKFFLGRLRLLEAALADGREFLCEGRFTIADIAIGYALTLGTTLGLKERMPAAALSYHARLIERPAYQRAIEKRL